jgi:hypothetical protein
VIRVPWRRRDLVLGLLFLLTLPAVNTRIHASDEIENFAYLRSIWFDGDLSFDNEYRHFYDAGFTRDPLFVATFLEPETATGRRPNYAPVGSAILWAPFFAVADIGVRLARAMGSTVPADGYARPYLAAIAIGSAVYGALALAISITVARRFAPDAWVAALVVFIGTPLIFYMYAMPGMSHATSAFAVALFVWTWLRVRERWTIGGVAGLAAVGALMGMVREQDAFLVLVPAVDYVIGMVRAGAVPWRDVPRRAAVAAAVFVAGFLPQLLAYNSLYGRFGPAQVIADKMQWHAPFAAGVVASPAHGWFIWTPLAVLAVGGLIVAARSSSQSTDNRRIAALLLLAVVIQIYVVGSLRSWTLEGAFGQRRFVGLSVCLIAGIAALWSHVPRGVPRRALAAVAVVTIWWNLGMAIRFGEGSMNRKRIELSRDIYATFIDLPRRLPGVAYRYLFNRQSFYEADRRGSLP